METVPQIDLYQHVSLHINALKYTCLWFFIPYSIKSIKFWISILMRIVIGILVFVMSTGGQIVYVIKLMISGEAEIQEIAGVINLVFTELLTSFKLLDLCLRRGLFTRLTDQLISSEFNCREVPHKLILENSVKTSRWLFWGLLCGAGVDITVHVIVVPSLHRFATLPLKMDLIFFDVNEEPYFKYICAYQILYKPIMLTMFTTLQTLPWAVMSCAIGQLDVLIYKFDNMKDLIEATKVERQCDEKEAFKEAFKSCVLHHRSIISYLNTLQATFSGQFLFTLILNACIIGTTGVQILSIEEPLKNISVVSWVLAYLCVIMGNLFIECYFGNAITVKSFHVATTVYSCPWINVPNGIKRSLVIFIANTQQPIAMKAAKLIPVSLETFTKNYVIYYRFGKFFFCLGEYTLRLVPLSSGYLMMGSWRYRGHSSVWVMNWTYKGFAVLNQMKK